MKLIPGNGDVEIGQRDGDVGTDLQRDCTMIRAQEDSKLVGYAIVIIMEDEDGTRRSRAWTNCDSKWHLASQVHSLAVDMATRDVEEEWR